MKKEVLHDALNLLDDDLVYEVEELRWKVDAARIGQNKRFGFERWVALAACACVAVVLVTVMSQSGVLQIGQKKESALETEIVKEESAAMDMLAFFIWQGRSYVEYERGLENVDLIGEYLGTAIGTIDEWTKEDGYVDFAGSISGDFYTVKGYDPSFMLCMKRENGLISTFVNDNDMILCIGADLFEERLHLTGNYEAVKYQTREDWQRSTGVICQVTKVDLEVVERFVDAVNKAPFLLTEDVPLEEGENLYDREIYHMFFEMKDGMTVHMRLYEGGYVRFHGLMSACVKVEEEVFEEMVAVMEP